MDHMRAIVAYHRWSWPGLWLVATGLLLGVEFQRQSDRSLAGTTSSATVPCITAPGVQPTPPSRLATETVEISQTRSGPTSFLLAVGCLGSVPDGEVEINLQAERTAEYTVSSVACAPFQARDGRSVAFDCLNPVGSTGLADSFENLTPLPHQDDPASRPKRDNTDHRLYFLPCLHDLRPNASVTAIPCQQISRSFHVRVFAENSLLGDADAARLAEEVVHEIEHRIRPALSRLVGEIRDLDGDGTMAVVLTSQLGQASGVYSGVDGLTRESDFRPEVPRPVGNGADVVFLNSRLTPGERLRAVLAHELAHAAIFSRRISRDEGSTEQRVSEDDWLNEALAHWIEVRASGSYANLGHRLARFVEQPESSPLVVRDYSRPGFWRHHGCRGAAYSFLDWCVNQFGEELVGRLIDSSDTGTENIEAATGRSFAELFRGWTVSRGERLVREEASLPFAPHAPHVSEDAVTDSRHGLRPQIPSWHLDPTKPNRRAVVLKGTTAMFLQVTMERGAPATWRLSAVAHRSQCPVQLTTIPIETGNRSSQVRVDR